MRQNSRLKDAVIVSPESNGNAPTTAEEEFLAGVMASVSTSLEAMSEEERERAVSAAERAVSHIQ
jgi:hypothetical protein